MAPVTVETRTPVRSTTPGAHTRRGPGLVVPQQPCQSVSACLPAPSLRRATARPARPHGAAPPDSVIGCRAPRRRRDEDGPRVRCDRRLTRRCRLGKRGARRETIHQGRAGMRVFAVNSQRWPAQPATAGGRAGANPLKKVCGESDYCPQLDPIPRLVPERAPAPARPRRKPAKPTDPPGRDAGRDLEHPTGPVQEDQVEREPHESRVDARARRQNQRSAGRPDRPSSP